MSLRLLLGRAGAGKTQTCVREIAALLRHDPLGPPLILLVPEQATFQMEQAISNAPGVGGFARLRITGFRRLAASILRETRGGGRPPISEVGRRMLIRSLLQRRRHDMRILGAGSIGAGLVERVENTLRELRAYGYRPEHVAAMAEALEKEHRQPLLAAKLTDLAVLDAEFQATLTSEYTDPDLTLEEASRQLHRLPWISEAEVWVDGYAGFTPAEHTLLSAIMAMSKRVTVALCLDPRKVPTTGRVQPETVGIFQQPAETYVDLRRAAEEQGVEIEPDERLLPTSGPRFANPALAHLERTWDDPVPRVYAELAGLERVSVRAARNRTDEVEAAALEILRLCRDEGYRFREISVVVRDLDAYAESVEAIFDEWQIPYFIDRRRPIAFHPLARLLLATLDVVRSRWDSDAVLRYLKSDLVPIERDAADQLENEVLRFGLTGSAWWDPEPKSEALQPLVQLAEGLNAPGLTRRRAAELLWQLLADLGVQSAIARWIAEAEEGQDTVTSSVHRQAWEGVVTLIDALGAIAPDEGVDVTTVAAMVEEGIGTLRLGLIPPNLDQVLVGAIDRSRQPNVRAVFVLGAVDREFPQVPSEDVVFSDNEREQLASAGYLLAATSRHRLQQERFLAYIAVTRASERLWVSYPKAGSKGKALFPSSIVDRLLRTLPTVRIVDVGAEGPNRHSAPPTARRLAAHIAEALRANGQDPDWLDVYEWVVSHPTLHAEARPILRSLGYDNWVEPLPEALIAELLGGGMRTSISRLQRFAACPFQHFAADALRLREREELRLDAGRMGSLYHSVMSAFVERLHRAGGAATELSDATALQWIDELLDVAAGRLRRTGMPMAGRERYQLRSARRTLHLAARILMRQLRVGAFRPHATELSFGRPGDRHPPWVPDESLRGWIELVGVIDRVDTAEIDGETYVRVIDYKSGSQKFGLEDIVYGLDLQLTVYLAVAARVVGGRPAGMFYVPLQTPKIKKGAELTPDEVWSATQKQLRARGVLLADPEVAGAMDGEVGPGDESVLFPFGYKKDGEFLARSRCLSSDDMDRLIEYVEGLVKRLAEAIRRGEHRTLPYRWPNGERPCQRCPYHAVCRFDMLVEGSEYRHLRRMKSTEVWEQIRTGFEEKEA